jgi:hypothetical protein
MNRINGMSNYIEAFPKMLQIDVRTMTKDLEEVYPTTFGPSAMINNERIKMPYRTYFVPLQQSQTNVYADETITLCLYTRHCNGYIREKSLKMLLNKNNLEYYAIPYVLKLAEEYILDITKIVLENLKNINITDLRKFKHENPLWVKLMKARSQSYWNLGYRQKYYYSIQENTSKDIYQDYQEYPGGKIVTYLEKL